MKRIVLTSFAFFLMAVTAAIGEVYVFTPDPSSVVKSGGITGNIRETYGVEGWFLLKVDPNTNTVSFDQVEGTLSDTISYLDQGINTTKSLNTLFRMTDLKNTDANETSIKFIFEKPLPGPSGTDIHLTVTFEGDSIRLERVILGRCC